MNESEFESDPKVIDQYVRLHRSGDPDAMQKASEFFYAQLNRFVVKLAHENYPTFMRTQGDDLIQCAWIGILEAIDRYDPYSYAMTTHFKPYILEQMSRCVSDVPTAHLFHNLNKLRGASENAGVDELAAKTGLACTSVKNAIAYTNIRQTVDFDEVDCFLVDDDPSADPEQMLLKEELKSVLYSELHRLLDAEELRYIADRFGLWADREPSKTVKYRDRPTLFAKLRCSPTLTQLALLAK